jgi:hypothetical protein
MKPINSDHALKWIEEMQGGMKPVEEEHDEWNLGFRTACSMMRAWVKAQTGDVKEFREMEQRVRNKDLM